MSQSDVGVTDGPTLLGSMWRFRYVLAVVTVLCGVAGYVLSASQPTTYEATASVVLTDPSEGGIFGTATRIDAERYLQQQANRASASDVFARAAALLEGAASAAAVERRVDIDADLDVGELTVSASGSDSEAVAATANAVARAYEQVRREGALGEVEAANAVIQEQVTRLREQSNELDQVLASNPDDAVAASRLETVQAELFALQTRMSELAANAAVFGAGIEMIEEATAPSAPSSPQPLRDALLLAILGLGVASAVAYWRAGSFKVVETRVDAGDVLDVQLLGEVPRFPRSAGGNGAGMILSREAAEAYEFLLSSIDFSLSEIGGTSILVTSAAPGDGKTSTALNLAIASARQERGVVLVDTDVRARGLTSLLHSQSRKGLVEIARGASLAECTRQYRVSEGVQISMVPAGEPPDEPTGLLRAPEFRRAIARIKEASELAIFDSAPLLSVADATVVAAQVDAIVIVVDSRTPVEELQWVRERLAFISTPVLGYVYNRAPSGRGTRYGRYGYGYGAADADRRPGMLRRLLSPTGGSGADGVSGDLARTGANGQQS